MMDKYLQIEDGKTIKVFEHECPVCGIVFRIKISADVPISDNDLEKVFEFDSAWRSHENGSHEYREYSQLIEVKR